MAKTILRKVGGSIMLAVPPALLELLNLKEGAAVALAVEGNKLTVSPQTGPRYSLEELLSQCNPEIPRSQEEQEWLDDRPYGRELI